MDATSRQHGIQAGAGDAMTIGNMGGRKLVTDPFTMIGEGCMNGWRMAAVILLGMIGTVASAMDPAVTPTGSPSNATATVSPTTVADAAMKSDDALPNDDSGRFGVSLGTSLASGDFGSDQGSRLWSTALGARYAIGGLRLTASIPYLEILSRGLIFSGIDSTPVIAAGGTPGPRTTNKGWGDITLGGAYTFGTGEGRPEVELSGRVKLPTATDHSQLSTGKTDYSVGAQVTQSMGRIAPFASVTYRIFGDPDTIDLRNGFAASAGSSFSLSGKSVALLSYHYARGASRLVRDAHEVFAGASTRIGDTALRATAYGTAGLSSGAAAVSGGLSVALDF